MSMNLMVQVLKEKIGSPARKLVLLKLADNANDAGECFPSYKHIADHCEMDRRTVIRHVKQLQKDGFLTIEKRTGPKGNSSNIFHIYLSTGRAKPSDNLSLPSGDLSLPPSGNLSPITSHSFEPVNEPINNNGANELHPVSKSKKSYPDEFEHLWKSKPPRLGSNSKASAFKACNARIKEGFNWVQLGSSLEAYGEFMRLEGKLNTQYVMQVSSFFGTGKHFLTDWQKQIHAFNHQAQQHAQQNRNRYDDQAQGFNAHQFNPSQNTTRKSRVTQAVDNILSRYTNTSTPTERVINPTVDTGLAEHQNAGGVRSQVAPSGITFNMDSGNIDDDSEGSQDFIF